MRSPSKISEIEDQQQSTERERPDQEDTETSLENWLRKLSRHARVEVDAWAETRMRRVAVELHHLATALNETSSKMNRKHSRTSSKALEFTAAQAESLAFRVNETEVRDVTEGLKNLARRRPFVFIGTATATGLLLGRFLKSRPPDDSSS